MTLLTHYGKRWANPVLLITFNFYVIFQSRPTPWVWYHRPWNKTGMLWWTRSRWQQFRREAITHSRCCHVRRVQRLHATSILMIDLYNFLTPDELETVTQIMLEATARNGIILDIWEPIIKVQTTWQTVTHAIDSDPQSDIINKYTSFFHDQTRTHNGSGHQGCWHSIW